MWKELAKRRYVSFPEKIHQQYHTPLQALLNHEQFHYIQGRPLHIRTVRTCVPFLAVTAHAHIGCTQWVNTWCTCTNTVQTRLPSHCLLVSLHARCHGAKTSTVTSRSPRTCQNAPYVGSKVIIMGTDVTVV